MSLATTLESTQPLSKKGRRYFRLSPYALKLFIPFHIFLLASFYAIEEFNLYQYLPFSILVWILVSGVGIAVGYHRLLSHRAFKTTKFRMRLAAYLGLLAGQESPFFWVAVHRGLHHPHSDTKKDPHSPIHGMLWSMFGWQLFFKRSDFDGRSAIDILRDPFLRFISIHYYKVYWFSLTLIFLVSWKFAVAAVIPALFVSLHQENIVNSLCHSLKFGYRNFETADHSVNNWLLGFFFWGQGFHNNHHQFPNRYDYGVRSWEFDPSRLIVSMMKTTE